MYTGLAILAVFTFAFSLLSARIDRLPTSAPVVFVLAGVLLGPLGLGWFSDDMGRSQFRILVDLTLAVILFTDAANSNLNVLRRNWKLPARMLGIGQPSGTLGVLRPHVVKRAVWVRDPQSIRFRGHASLLRSRSTITQAVVLSRPRRVPCRRRTLNRK